MRHRVTVPRGVQRLAYILRGLQHTFKGLRSAGNDEQYQRLIHQCELASQPIWGELTAAVKSGTLLVGSSVVAALRQPAVFVGAYRQPTGPTAWCLGLVGNRPYFGHGEPSSEFSTQPQVVSRIGLHVAPPGQALGLTSSNPPVLVSCVLDLISSVYDAGPATITSTESYADKVFQQQQLKRVIMHVPTGHTQAWFIRAVTESVRFQSPVQGLVKHSLKPALLPFIGDAVLDCPRVVADPKSLSMHYLGLALVCEVGAETFTRSM